MAQHVVLWDPLVRVFHWTLAAAFVLNRFFTEAGDRPHQVLGYVAVTFIALRVAWGFAPTGAARWAHFWPTGPRIAAHLREIKQGRPHRRLGHSPLGAVVVVTMMSGIVALGITGYAMQEIDYFWGDERIERLHSLIADAVTALAACHVVAAVIQSLWLGENLPLSMVTGRRRLLSSEPIRSRVAEKDASRIDD
jgi:cytochrome b